MSSEAKAALENYYNESIKRLQQDPRANMATKQSRNMAATSVRSSLKSGSVSSFFSGSTESLTDYKDFGNMNDLFTKNEASSRPPSTTHRSNEPASCNGVEHLDLKKQNEELLYVNRIFKDELERLSNQITLIERKQVS